MFKSLVKYLFTEKPLPGPMPEIIKAEVVTSRTNEAQKLQDKNFMSDYDILTKWLNYPPAEAEKMVSRLKIQKLEDLKLQIMAQNPQILGIGMP